MNLLKQYGAKYGIEYFITYAGKKPIVLSTVPAVSVATLLIGSCISNFLTN